MHIERQQNQEADNLSKEALSTDFGLLFWEENMEGSLVDKGTINFFDYDDVNEG